MNHFIKILSGEGEAVAPPQLVFLSVVLVAIFQFPAHFLMRIGWISSGILTNEIVAVLGVPIAIVSVLKFDKKTLFPAAIPRAFIFPLLFILTLGADLSIDYLTAASEYFFPLPDQIRNALNALMAISDRETFVMKVMLLCVIPGVCEEIFFRGFCQTSLTMRWGVRPAIVASSLIFALLHGNPWYFHLYFILGLFFGWIYSATGTLVAPIFCHIMNNAWTLTMNHFSLKVPLSKPFGTIDAAMVASAIIIFVVCAILLINKMNIKRSKIG